MKKTKKGSPNYEIKLKSLIEDVNFLLSDKQYFPQLDNDGNMLTGQFIIKNCPNDKIRIVYKRLDKEFSFIHESGFDFINSYYFFLRYLCFVEDTRFKDYTMLKLNTLITEGIPN